MSWGGGEFAGESTYDSYFTTPAGHTGVTFVASIGRHGAPGAEYPVRLAQRAGRSAARS